jgi:hypothetical protein
MAFNTRIAPSNYEAAFSDYYRSAEQRMERAALIATDRAAREAKPDIRNAMAASGLGRLGNAIDDGSDLRDGKGVHRYGNGGFSASGRLFIRSGSERTRGAIEAYTQGAEITPKRGRWLWIPSDDIQRLVGSGKTRARLTPGNWSSSGMDSKVGPLVFAQAANGNPLLIVRNVGVSLAGKKRSARSLTKRGLPRKGQVARDFIVAFIGIPRTSRAARVDVPHILSIVQGQMLNYYKQALGRI